MSADLELISAKVDNLSFEDLLTLQQQVANRMRQKFTEKQQIVDRESIIAKFALPKPTPEQLEADLARMFSPESRAQFDKIDLSNKVIFPKPASEMINEDREDRI